MNTTHNGLSNMEAKDLLILLRKCAWIPSSSDKDSKTDLDGCVKTVNDLKASCIHKEHCNVCSWLEPNWLTISEVIYILYIISYLYFYICRNEPMLFVIQLIMQLLIQVMAQNH